jgi:hypothetical protein
MDSSTPPFLRAQMGRLRLGREWGKMVEAELEQN